MVHFHHFFGELFPLIFLIYFLSLLPPVDLTFVATYPCPSLDPIKWVRDPNDCHKYFICYFGQPITMPKCPLNQVWSNGALNCVPERSTWNDCTRPTLSPGNKQTTKVLNLDQTMSQVSFTTVSMTTKPTSAPPTRSPPPPTTTSRFTDHPCFGRKGLLRHPTQCHWYYNCSLSVDEQVEQKYEPFTVECKYPRLFDEHQMRCREFLNFDCGSRFEPVDRCEYRQEQCDNVHCIPCEERFANCRGKPDGIYPFRTDIWSPIFVSCFRQRNIAQDKCPEATPLYSPVENNCVSLLDVPKENGGLKPDCSFRRNGLYADEQGRCSVYFECRDKTFVNYLECEPASVFDPLTRSCTDPKMAPPPCGENSWPPSCRTRQDGYYADEYGRCPYYFECRNFTFKSYYQCDFGSFDANQQKCVIPVELMIQPCGMKRNPCNNRPDGNYAASDADLSTLRKQCSTYIECKGGLLIHNGVCQQGKVFNKESGRCDQPDNVPMPCGKMNVCAQKKDGRYAAPDKGCGHFYECYQGKFQGFKVCDYKFGGRVFNAATGKCDLRQNVCPPCGYKWYDCHNSRLS